MKNYMLHLSAAAALLVATPSIASATTIAYGNAAPVTLETCSFTVSDAPRNLDTPLAFGGPVSFYGPSGADTLAVAYVNNGNVPATAVRIVLRGANDARSLTATGTFAPGVRINKKFVADFARNADTNASCSIAEVDFANGTSWHAPSDVANR